MSPRLNRFVKITKFLLPCPEPTSCPAGFTCSRKPWIYIYKKVRFPSGNVEFEILKQISRAKITSTMGHFCDVTRVSYPLKPSEIRLFCQQLVYANIKKHQICASLRTIALSSIYIHILTHWDRDQLADISQTTFWNSFSLMKIYEFRSIFHWSFFPTGQLTIFRHWFRYNGLAPPRRQAIIWTNDGKFTDAYMHHSASASEQLRLYRLHLHHTLQEQVNEGTHHPFFLIQFPIKTYNTVTKCCRQGIALGSTRGEVWYKIIYSTIKRTTKWPEWVHASGIIDPIFH